MRWEDRRRSSNVEDRRGQTMRRGATIGGGSIVMALVAIFLLGKPPEQVMQEMAQKQAQSQRQAQTQTTRNTNPQEDKVVAFMATTLADTEDTWSPIFAKSGQRYKTTNLVVYDDRTHTACGPGSASAGPFYCPGDEKIYIDPDFIAQLQQMGASGDFALAYVLAHEVGHHIQTQLGISNQVRYLQSRARSKADANALQVRMELQADCFAGIWAHHNQKRTGFLQPGDVEEGLEAAAAVGDDTIMRNAGRRPVKEAFTHGSSQQRMEWLTKGLKTGELGSCMAGIEPQG